MTVDLLAQRVPARLTRESRIRMLLAATEALRTGLPVPDDAARYLGAALSAWLANGGSLERDHLRVASERGSHRTPRAVALRLTVKARAVDDATEAGETLRFSSSR